MKRILTFKQKVNENLTSNGSVADAIEVAETSGVPTIICSEPGTGKGHAIKQYAESNGYKFVQIDGATISMDDIQLPKRKFYLDKDYLDYKMSSWWPKEGEKTILYVAEIDRATEAIQKFFMQMVFENKIPKGTTLLFGCSNIEELNSTFVNKLNVISLT